MGSCRYANLVPLLKDCDVTRHSHVQFILHPPQFGLYRRLGVLEVDCREALVVVGEAHAVVAPGDGRAAHAAASVYPWVALESNLGVVLWAWIASDQEERGVGSFFWGGRGGGRWMVSYAASLGKAWKLRKCGSR